MITGTVNELLEATVSLQLRSADDTPCSIDAIIDTGFSGDLTLPQSTIESLGLSWLCRQQGILADGSLHTCDVYTGTIIWDGDERIIEIEAAEVEPLVGMSLLEGNRLSIDVRAGGKISIDCEP